MRQHGRKCQDCVGRLLLRRCVRLEERTTGAVPQLEDVPVARRLCKDRRELREKRDGLQLRADDASVRRLSPADERESVTLEPRPPGEILRRTLEAFFKEGHVTREEATFLLRRAAFLRERDAASRNPSKGVPHVRLAARDFRKRFGHRTRADGRNRRLGRVLGTFHARGQSCGNAAFDERGVLRGRAFGQQFQPSRDHPCRHPREHERRDGEQGNGDGQVGAALHRFISASAG